MESGSKIVTITGRVHPHVCGIGDYTLNLATACQARLNSAIHLIVEQGCHPSSEPVKILPYVAQWNSQELQKLLNFLDSENVDIVILQYAPWLYSTKGYDLDLINFWQQCSQRFKTLLIVHETYFWFLKHPGTWMVGLFQQYVLRALVNASHHNFSGCELYLNRLKKISKNSDSIHYLPIPSNIQLQALSETGKQELCQHLEILPHSIVLTLFGCVESIYPEWITALDICLKQLNYSIVWLFLGKAQSLSIPLQNRAIRPGYLNPEKLSHYLQISDLMLMPHKFGVSAKRTSLMSALEHGLPIVGTTGLFTDSFLDELPNILLAADGNYAAFEKQVLNALSNLPELLTSAQIGQEYYRKNLSWNVVAETLSFYF